MSKEAIKASQFKKAELLDDTFSISEEQKNELKELYRDVPSNYKPGMIVQGKVMDVTPDGVLVDISFKSNGLIPLYEFSDHELKKLVPNSVIEVVIDELENLNGNVILSYEKAKSQRAWDNIVKLFEENKPVEGVVTHKVKGGLSVDIGVPAFLPGSQVDVQRVTDFDQYVGQTITANIIKINQKRGNVIISRRKYLHDQRSEFRKQILDTLSVGQIIQGVVKNITNYGVFIDIGGLDGLLHVTDMTWGRISHPSEMVKIGDTVTVKVLSFDKNNEKISLGIKQLTENPWDSLPADIKVGSKVKGAITSITDYGIFVEISKGVEGLVHISEVSWTDKVSDLLKQYKVGDSVEVYVVSLDKENRRMSLSLKQLEKNPWDEIEDRYPVGARVKGIVSNLTDFGIFVQLEPGVDGLVHVSDISWTEHIEHPADKFKKGDPVEAIVLGVNKQNKKISLGVKQLTQDPWQEIETTYQVGSMIEGEVTKITNFGAFIKLPTGIEGLVHSSEMNGARIDDILKVGQKDMFKILKVNQEEHKISLGLREELAPRRERSERSDSRGSRKPSGDFGPMKRDRDSRDNRDRRYESNGGSNKPKSQFQLELEKMTKKNDK